MISFPHSSRTIRSRLRTTIFLALILSVSLSDARANDDMDAVRHLAKEYGLFCPSGEARQDVIREGQNLADILVKEGVAYSTIVKAMDLCRPFFDVRKIRAGNPYTVIHPTGRDDRYFIYEKNPVEYLVFALGETVEVYEDRKPVLLVPRTVEGVIDSSLLASFSDLGLDNELAIKLSEVYAWTLDFYHFRKGDSFKLMFEEKLVNGKPVGCERILGARITHKGEDYYAFNFEKDGAEQYFDESGASLRKAFLKAPLKYARVSSGYSESRLHPVLNYYRPHLGIDYAAPTGTPVMSVGDGVVEKVEFNGSMGRYIQIRHSKRYMTQYLHLSATEKGIAKGKRIRQGDVIGYVGSTGLATGPHLDFRFWADGKALNFLKQDLPTAEPVKGRDKDRYLRTVVALKPKLDRTKDEDTSIAAIPGPTPRDGERSN